MTGIYTMFGMTVESSIPLPAPGGDGPPDLRIASGQPRTVPDARPDGTLIAGDVPPLVNWVVRRQDDTIVLRIPTLADILISPGLAVATIAIDPSRDPGVASVLATGTVPAIVLGLRGIATLHASAVAAGGGALVFAGHSGTGKSTLAALLCGAGARLITDDLVRLDDGDRVLPGATHIRLREAAHSLATDLAAPSETTPDQRLAVAPAAAGAPVPVTAVVLGRPNRQIETTQIVRLNPAAAASALLEFSRVRGWRDPAAIRALFGLCSRLARYPVFIADVPWGPPFSPATAQALLALGQESKLRR